MTVDGDDVLLAATSLTTLLTRNAERDFSVRAGELTWTIAEVVAHVADGCGSYAIYLGSRSQHRLRFDVTLHPGVAVTDRVAVIGALTEHLAEVIRAAPPDARGWHRFGLADAEGFAAMACDELLVHGSDLPPTTQLLTQGAQS